MAKLTYHAEERSKERLGLSKSSAARNAQTAFRDGLRHGELTGNLLKYADGQFLKHGTANNIRVYGDYFYIFSAEVLITVIPVPVQMRKIAAKLRKRRLKNAQS